MFYSPVIQLQDGEVQKILTTKHIQGCICGECESMRYSNKVNIRNHPHQTVLEQNYDHRA